jgi:glycosyltransferase involved in cell wall biosynthesis
MAIGATKEPDVSVIIATYNRCEILRGTLESLMNQDSAGIQYEIIVIDNNSTDDTRKTVEDFGIAFGYHNLIYGFEAKQGVSYARNKGIVTARAPIIAFIDDDIRPSPNWVALIYEMFKKFPEIDCVGGKVLPEAHTRFPVWLTKEYWSPLALLDLGDEELELNVRGGPGLVGANLAIRASAFKQVGFFAPQVQRVKDSIGSMEDHEFQLRLSASRKRLMYCPELVVYAHVLEERFDKSYHRRWHYGHGHFYAVMRDEQFESSKVKLFDVPAHFYRATCSRAIDWLIYCLTRKRELEFQQELEIRFFWGFFRKRFAERRSILQWGQR